MLCFVGLNLNKKLNIFLS